MNPTFFGKAESPLYGIYLPPRATPRDAGIVLCYPFGQEYMRAHRAYRQLALLLAKKGYHVLRFDYRGTGDSSGDMESVVLQDWFEDIGHAIQELRDSAGVSTISVVGLRLGALVAAGACAQRTDVDRLILWDPVVQGTGYEQQLQAAIRDEKPDPWGGPSSGNLEMDNGAIYFNGFLLNRAFRDALRGQDLAKTAAPAGINRILQVVSHETDEFAALRAAWQSHKGFQYLFTPAPHDWNYVDNFGGILLPQPVIQAIVNWVD